MEKGARRAEALAYRNGRNTNFKGENHYSMGSAIGSVQEWGSLILAAGIGTASLAFGAEKITGKNFKRFKLAGLFVAWLGFVTVLGGEKIEEQLGQDLEEKKLVDSGVKLMRRDHRFSSNVLTSLVEG